MKESEASPGPERPSSKGSQPWEVRAGIGLSILFVAGLAGFFQYRVGAICLFAALIAFNAGWVLRSSLAGPEDR